MNQKEIYDIINRTKIPSYLLELWNKLSNFVEKECSSRDTSHGFFHMRQVARTSLYIQSNDYPDMSPNMVKVLIASAWLHDVADHKYDHDGKLGILVDQFLESELSKYKIHILMIIKSSSFTFEKNNNITQWDQLYDKPKYATIRHIMSDADKLDALGSRGITRIIEYANHAGCHIKSHMQNIAVNRILVLKNGYIRTKTGYELACIFHDEFEELFNLNFL